MKPGQQDRLVPTRFFRSANKREATGHSHVLSSELTLLIKHLKRVNHTSMALFCLSNAASSVADPKAALTFVLDYSGSESITLPVSRYQYTCQRMLFEQPTMSIYCYCSGKSTSCAWFFAHL